jgi:hypothetical protein
MANPVGAISFDPKVTLAQTPPAAPKPAANVAKATPQDTINISAAGQAASQSQPALKASGNEHKNSGSK